VVEKGRYKKTLIENNGLFSILDHPDLTLQIGWNVEAYKDERELFVQGYLMSMLLPYASPIVLIR
jgi:hypothetical protein